MAPSTRVIECSEEQGCSIRELAVVGKARSTASLATEQVDTCACANAYSQAVSRETVLMSRLLSGQLANQ